MLTALVTFALGGLVAAAQQTPARPTSAQPAVLTMSDADIDRVEHWIEGIVEHQPGAPDSTVTTVEAWSSDDLRTLWINATVLLALMGETRTQSQGWSFNIAGLTKSSKTRTFTVQGENQRKATEVRYNPVQLRRMEVFACAAAGDDLCMDLRTLGRDAQQLTRMPAAQRRKLRPAALQPLYDAAAIVHNSGDDNFLLHHGAMLHADVATGDPPALAPSKKPNLPAPQQMHLQLFDGRETSQGEVAIHWIIGRLLLDAVTVVEEKKRVQAPSRDPIVRDWYHASAAWMQQRENFDTAHVHHAVELFPDDPDILFLAGCLHETLASSSMSAAAAVAVAPAGFTFDIASARTELSRSEAFFRRALQARPAMLEARLHLGQVLLAQRQFDTAAQQLRTGAPDDEVLRYYHSLFLGSAEEELGRYDAASDAYSRAAALQEIAQAPRLALVHLAWRRGNRSDAIRALQQLSDLPQDDSVERDPWWTYYTSSARNAGQLMDDLRQRLR
jgi:hypothetical protein